MQANATAPSPVGQVNQITLNETITGQTAPTYRPEPLRHENWERWPMRWLAFFSFGVTAPSLMAILPGLAALVFLTLVLIAALFGVGWSNWHRSHRLPAIVAILSFTTGILFSLTTLAYHYVQPKPSNAVTVSTNCTLL